MPVVVVAAAVAAAALGAGGFFVVADLIVPITVFFAAGPVVLAALDAVVFFNTVVVLPSLDSLVPLTFRLPRVEAAVGGRGLVAACRERVGAGPLVELAAEEMAVVVFLVRGCGRVAFAFSTIFVMRLDEVLAPGAFMGDAGLLAIVLTGDVGRGTSRVLEDAGDRT